MRYKPNVPDIYQILSTATQRRLSEALGAPRDSPEGAEVLALVDLIAIYWMREIQ